jgi:hypothetical protein
MATPNYSFEKRRKELERKSKKQKKAESKLKKDDIQDSGAINATQD